MKIAIYCGSSHGNNPVYKKEAVKLATYLAAQGIDLVYGGAEVGLMGSIADEFLRKGQKVYGFIPESLKNREIAHKSLTSLTVVSTMHERKSAMIRMADALVALPGGTGTLDELFEAWAWAQLGIHSKPCALYNIEGYYDPLKLMIERMKDEGFLQSRMAELLIHSSKPSDLLTKLRAVINETGLAK
jgi:uncharacterized protein (TIGR00730 family)